MLAQYLLVLIRGSYALKSTQIILAAIALATCISLTGCGGGDGGGGSSTGVGGSTPARTLNWVPPTQYSDSTSLNPATDLDVFEVYINSNGSFSVSDSAMAAVSASDPGTGQVTTTFNLGSLSPFLSNGVTYYVSVRAVAKNGLKSDFSQAATFSF